MFIVIEGLDGAGTTTQTELLAAWARAEGHSVHTTREPSDGPIGVMIRQMLARRIVGRNGASIDRETLALLFAADRVDHVRNEIEPKLDDDAWVVSDRYYHSSFAYQGDVDDEDHFDIDWVRTLNSRARTPDVTFFLSVPVDVCLERLGDRGHRDIYETKEKLERLARRYDQIVEALVAEGEHIVTVDGTQGPDDVTREMAQAIDTLPT
jgi:dTMP kinase